MSDVPNDIPLDPGTNTTPPLDSTSSDLDPDSNSTGDSDSGIPSDPNAGTVDDPLGGGTDSTSTSGFGQNGADSGIPDSVNQDPAGAQEASLFPSSSITAGTGLQPTARPNSIADTNGSAPHSLGSKSDKSTKTIIIASSVSGGVALILVLLVIFVVYRRRNTRRRGANFVNAIPELERRGSDATWIGPAAGKSFDDDSLEAGNRNSDASFESETTLADVTAARAKSGAFSTPSHTPRPSIDKIKTDIQPMVPEDPFEKPRLSLADGQRTSLDQAAPQPVTLPRQRRSAAPNMRINSGSRFNDMVEIEQGDIVGPQSPEFVLPLVTPIGPPPGWRGSRGIDYIRAPTRRDSMISLSRQSSRASSRNSQIFEQDDAPGKRSSIKAVFNSALAKKRRSRADSIDPFRKSSATMMSARRKSRAESVASARYHANGAPAAGPGARRKSRAESIAPPTTPGGRRKSRAASLAPSVAPRRRSQAASSAASPRQSTVFSAPVEYMPPAAIGLPRTPRTPTAAMARQSRIPDAQVPRTPTARTPRTVAPREPRTPSTREPRTPSTREPRTPVAREPRTPMTAREASYSVREPQPRTPASARDPRTPRTPGGHPRVPSARVPRTPTSLEDAVHWSDVPLPSIPPPPPAPEQPRVPATTPTKAELRLSQLSRALSEVSSRDSHY
ncbi:hypothetical protein C8Q70DRAFT_116985 [Cubamyces menziesii]|nr:hypothetical protein C8Q70DRAFT_116985 [Cubamyces menziesii]